MFEFSYLCPGVIVFFFLTHGLNLKNSVLILYVKFKKLFMYRLPSNFPPWTFLTMPTTWPLLLTHCPSWCCNPAVDFLSLRPLHWLVFYIWIHNLHLHTNQWFWSFRVKWWFMWREAHVNICIWYSLLFLSVACCSFCSFSIFHWRFLPYKGGFPLHSTCLNGNVFYNILYIFLF